MKGFVFSWVAFLALTMTGCSATHTMIAKRNLDVQTKMSETVFLDPVSSDKRTVFLQLRNTSDKPDLVIEPQIIAAVEKKGYTVVNDPDKAHYLIQANILQVGKSNLRDAEGWLSQGYGGAAAGAIAGAQFGSGKGTAAAGIGGALLGIIGDAMVEDVFFSMITDLQISERANTGVVVTEAVNSKLKQGTSGFKNVSSTEETNWKRYQTRIVSTANKVNLDFVEAQPVLEQGLVNSISGLL